MALSYADIEGIWIKAGGSAGTAPLAAAVAMAESGGNPNALNNNSGTGDLSYGLWQINMIGTLGPSRRREFGIQSNSALLDPVTNAKAAVKVSNGGTNFSAWTTFTSGAFKKFLNGSVPPNQASGGTSGPTDTLASFQSDVVSPIVDNVENMLNYIYMGILVVGGVLLITGALWAMSRDSEVVTAGSSVGRAIYDVTLFRHLRGAPGPRRVTPNGINPRANLPTLPTGEAIPPAGSGNGPSSAE
jgi:hypothetical protein